MSEIRNSVISHNSSQKIPSYNKIWMCPKEVAYDLSVSYKTALTLIKKGKLRAYKIGRHYKVDPKDVQVYIENNKVSNFIV